MKKDFAARATDVFGKARKRVTASCASIHAEHSAKGLLGSGATAKRAVRAARDEFSEALAQLLAEVAREIEHRGMLWNDAIDRIDDVLSFELQSVRQLIEPSLKLAGADQGSASAAVDALLAENARDLRRQLEEFKAGWTAPKPRRWSERQPVTYAILLLIAGSIIGGLVSTAISTIANLSVNEASPKSQP